MKTEATPDLALAPVTITLDAETAFYLLQALKKAISYGNLDRTGVRVYEEVVQAIVTGIDPPLAEDGPSPARSAKPGR
jgi:hypothetical protein